MRIRVPGRGMLLLSLLSGMISLFPAPGFQAAAAGETVFSIQVAATQDRSAAEKKVAELKKMGHNAFHRQETIQGRGAWYRVYVEKFSSKAEAEKEAKILKSLGLFSDYAVRGISEEPEPPAGGEAGRKPKAAGGTKTPPPERADKEAGPTVYYLHIGSFKEKENAEKDVQELVKHGQKAFFVEEVLSGEKWFRVYVGEFKSEKEARSLGTQLKEKGLIHYFKAVRLGKGAPSP